MPRQADPASGSPCRRMDYLLAAPTLLWLTIFFLVPYFIVFIYGFLTPDIFDVKFEFSLDAYRQILNGTYFKPFFLSFRLALLTTMLCVLLGYPVPTSSPELETSSKTRFWC